MLSRLVLMLCFMSAPAAAQTWSSDDSSYDPYNYSSGYESQPYQGYTTPPRYEDSDRTLYDGYDSNSYRGYDRGSSGNDSNLRQDLQPSWQPFGNRYQ